jgi:hypothetical protein
MEDVNQNITFNTLKSGEVELFRIYYDKNNTTFDEMLIIEQISVFDAFKKNWKILKAFDSVYIYPFLVCKN